MREKLYEQPDERVHPIRGFVGIHYNEKQNKTEGVVKVLLNGFRDEDPCQYQKLSRFPWHGSSQRSKNDREKGMKKLCTDYGNTVCSHRERAMYFRQFQIALDWCQ